MITFKPKVFAHHKRKDGLFLVTIRVTFKRQSRFMRTSIYVTSADVTRSMKIKSPEIIAKCSELTDRLRKLASTLTPYELEGKDVDWVVKTLTERMRKLQSRRCPR